MDTKHDPGLFRRVIIDMLPHAAEDHEIQELQERLGLVPSSLDVLALERRESNTRIANTSSISDPMRLMSRYAAESVAEYFLMQIDSVVEDDNEVGLDTIRKALIRQNEMLIATAVHAIVSHMITAGILAVKE